MALEILRRTPVWVWIVLAALIAYGWYLGRPQRIARARVLVLPLVLTVIAVAGVVSVFGRAIGPLLAFGVGFSSALGLNQWLQLPGGVRREADLYLIPGSWIPLLLMLGIFLTKFAVGVISNVRPDLLARSDFPAAAAAVYGLTSGLFAARALHILRTRD